MSDADLITEASASRITLVRELANRFDVAVEENARLRRIVSQIGPDRLKAYEEDACPEAPSDIPDDLVSQGKSSG